ncbi:hypothetical protein M2323_003975 [Rhodoblastus acidophilus]|uniref:hypothetical protein n=1 Tax=Rhodoblastus acidophilus TaxID=1074 RepID=UPI0022252469|nr:hypothetical protein [Rhodoblastus acidophilus]MCW2286138.1 hypothetical protein [Rhodoblastus acidophilus]MCW2335032.1 hypothetical protein [Rhodoblastus acidophilus]
MTEALPIQPPTIAHMESLGVAAFFLICGDCKREKRLTFEDVALARDTPFPEIPRARRFVCSTCGGRKISAFPDWTDYKFRGMRRRDT